MAIAELFKYQHAYNTNGTFDDKSDWKTAFDIANSFSNARNNNFISLDNVRKYYENINTSAGRVAGINATNQHLVDTAPHKTLADIAKYNTTIHSEPHHLAALNAQNQAIAAVSPIKADWSIADYGQKMDEMDATRKAQEAFQKLYFNDNGTRRTLEERARAAYEMGLSPEVFAKVEPNLRPAEVPASLQTAKFEAQAKQQQEMNKHLLELDNKLATGEITKEQYGMMLSNLNNYYGIGQQAGTTASSAAAQPTQGSNPQGVTVPSVTVGAIKIRPDLMPSLQTQEVAVPYAAGNSPTQTQVATQSPVAAQPSQETREVLPNLSANGLYPNLEEAYQTQARVHQNLVARGAMTQQQAETD